MITINLTELKENQLIAVLDIAQRNLDAISNKDFHAIMHQLRALIGTEEADKKIDELASQDWEQ